MSMFIRVVIFYQGFLSQTLTILRTAGEGREPSLPLPLSQKHSDICNFACEMTKIILLDGIYSTIFFKIFCYRKWTQETGESKFTATIALVFQVNGLTNLNLSLT